MAQTVRGPEDSDAADVIVLNTCVVRQSAEDKVYGRLGQQPIHTISYWLVSGVPTNSPTTPRRIPEIQWPWSRRGHS